MPDRYLGRTIGKYRVTRLLGTGAFAWVYEAVDQDLEIAVALKVLRPEFAGQDTAEGRFRREAATAARLRHPNIVTVRDVGQIDGTAFVAMDLYPVTLGRRLALVERLPEAEAVRLGIGIAAALTVAHASQIIHRDIKPDNILIDGDGEAVVADFGLARALTDSSSMSATNQVLGTPHYFSPEQARGQELDGRSDLYALGVTLYRAVTGRVPFEGDDWYAVARQHIEDIPLPPRTMVPELSTEFEQVILRLLAKSPDERFGSALQVVDALAALPSAPEPGIAARRLGSYTLDAFRHPGRRRPWRWVAVALAGIGLASVWGVRQWNARSTVFPAPPAILSPPADSGPVVSTPTDTVGGQSPAPVPPPDAPAPQKAVRPPRPASKVAHLELSAPGVAEIFVDNELVGVGTWAGDRPITAPITLRAALPQASSACQSAVFDTVLSTLSAGQLVVLEMPVRDCATVRYIIQPRDARVSFIPLDGGRTRELRADSAASLSLPLGRYLLRIAAPRCSTFQDTINVIRTSESADISRSLICS